MSNIHNEWDERYSQHDHIYGDQANAFIQEITQKLPIQGKTLGLAEGEGRNLLYLAALAQTKGQTFEADLWDYSQVALDKAQGYAQQRGLSLNTQKQDLSQVNWQANQYDNMICVFGHFNPETQQKVLNGVRETLVNGGLFVGELYSTSQLEYKTGGPRAVEMLYDPIQFLSHFKHDHLIHFFVGDVERSEGKLHQGKSHVIQFAIRIQK